MIPQTARDSQGNSDKRFRRADRPLKACLRIQMMRVCVVFIWLQKNQIAHNTYYTYLL